MGQSAKTPPAGRGSYVLLMRLDAPRMLAVGRLGRFDFPAGLYAYVGSAQGSGGLRARVGRHLRADKRAHWHVDALTAHAAIVAVWAVESAERLECAWARILRGMDGVEEPAGGFGASDCACRTHLFRLDTAALDSVRAALGGPEIIYLREG
jgi:Uri superfamily endonuclease